MTQKQRVFEKYFFIGPDDAGVQFPSGEVMGLTLPGGDHYIFGSLGDFDTEGDLLRAHRLVSYDPLKNTATTEEVTDPEVLAEVWGREQDRRARARYLYGC